MGKSIAHPGKATQRALFPHVGTAIDHASFPPASPEPGTKPKAKIKLELAALGWIVAIRWLSLLLISCRCGLPLVSCSRSSWSCRERENGLFAPYSVHLAGGLRLLARHRAANAHLHFKRWVAIRQKRRKSCVQRGPKTPLVVNI